MFLCLALIFIAAATVGCSENGKAQGNETDFTESYSGSFVGASIVTDTNDDGKPSTYGEFEGTSTFGPVMIQSLNEFALANDPSSCPQGQLEFDLVQGNFVKRFENGDLIFGTWESGTSCFDPTTNTSSTTQNGTFSGGTGQFNNATGPIEISYDSTFLATSDVDGFIFGGASGTGSGTVIFE